MVKTDERSSSTDGSRLEDGRPTVAATAGQTAGNGVVPNPPMPTRQAGNREVWLLLGAVLVAVVLVAVLVAIPGSRPVPAGTVLPETPLDRIVGDVRAALAPSSHSLPVVLAKLALAATLGGIIGYRRRLPIDDYIIQAHVIIAFTGALMMIIIGDQLVTAVGLLGAGSIIRYRSPVQDPRALATLFVTMGVGIAIGVGLYELALLAAVLIVGLQGLAGKIAGALPPTLYTPQRTYTMKLTAQDGPGAIARVEETFAARGIRSRLQEYDVDEHKHDPVKVTMRVEAPAAMTPAQLASLVASDGVRSVSVEEQEA
jgi:uncharacterized membrane protein YhiD involved in acid resistance